MAEILGLGLSHYPPFSGLDGSMADILRWTLEDPDIPAAELLENDLDPAYSYQPLHHGGLPHAFLNAVLYLDYHRTGFDYPVIPSRSTATAGASSATRASSAGSLTSLLDDVQGD